ncbi:MAG: hypothetical protein Q9160_005925 [Pyrenula sp. 1 TL-2023]
MSTPIQQHILTSNARYASSFPSTSTQPTSATDPLSTPKPAKHFALLTCMDARVDPAAAFGLTLCDAHVIRNGGGSARDALRSLVLSNCLLETREILVVKHTDCGMTHFGSDEEAREVVVGKRGEGARGEVEGMQFLGFRAGEEEEEARRDVEWLRGRKVIGEGVKVSGWVYDVRTGKVKQVV